MRNLQRLKSDHKSILVTMNLMANNGNRPFRCMDSWMLHGDIQYLVQNNWKGKASVVENLERF